VSAQTSGRAVRDSLLAKTSVISFILLVSGLLVGALVKDRIRDSPLSDAIEVCPAVPSIASP
jgi:hypothetical protein